MSSFASLTHAVADTSGPYCGHQSRKPGLYSENSTNKPSNRAEHARKHGIGDPIKFTLRDANHLPAFAWALRRYHVRSDIPAATHGRCGSCDSPMRGRPRLASRGPTVSAGTITGRLEPLALAFAAVSGRISLACFSGRRPSPRGLTAPPREL